MLFGIDLSHVNQEKTFDFCQNKTLPEAKIFW